MANLNAISNTAPQITAGNGTYDSYKPSAEGDSFQDMMQQTASAEDTGTKEYGPKNPGLAKPVKPEADQSQGGEAAAAGTTILDTSVLALFMATGEPAVMPEILDVQLPIQTSVVAAIQTSVVAAVETEKAVQQPVTSQPKMAQTAPVPTSETDSGSSHKLQIQPEIVETTQDYIKNTSLRPQEDSYEQAIKSLQAERKTSQQTPVQESTSAQKADVPVEHKSMPGQQEQPSFSMEAKTSGETVVAESRKGAEGESEIEILDLTKQTILSEPKTTAKDVEVVHIKVAEPFREVNQSMMRQVSQTIQDTAQAGKQEVVIQLNPEHLGKIAIKITMLDDGIKVALSCDNAKTQSLMAEKAAGIGRIVEESMHAPVTVEVKDGGYWNQQKDATDQQANHQNRQQQEKETQENTDEFIQQLRLGLVSQQMAG